MMISYVFIESRDPFETNDTRFVVETAADLKAGDSEVTVFLVQNGVLAARRGARDFYLRDLIAAGVRVLADDFSLAERGIDPGQLRDGVRPSGLGALVEMLAREGTRPVWY
jgi:predicted peroxiredoxin